MKASSLSEEIDPLLMAAQHSRSRFYQTFFKDVPKKLIRDWRWQLANRITNLQALQRFLNLSEAELSAFTLSNGNLPLSITPHYMSLLDPNNPDQAIRKSVVPTHHEWIHDKFEQADPLGEDKNSPVPGLVHRYPDRVLFLVTNYCSVYCRYCTRSRLVGHSVNMEKNKSRWLTALNYIEKHSEIRDVLLSGGDPLTLPDETLEWLISSIRKIPHVEIIRIGTKVPVVLPQRITPALCRLLKKYHPIFLSLHFTHADELSEETRIACNRLANAGIVMGSQTVLLKGINDHPSVMKKLMRQLLTIRVKPYYIFQCDPILGSGHFRTRVETGIDIIRALRGHTSGYAVPNYVIDAPGGGGKIPLLPEYYQGRDGDEVVLKNYEGKLYRYPDPAGNVYQSQMESRELAQIDLTIFAGVQK